MDLGAEKVDDAGVAAALRQQARTIHVHALLLATVLTGLTMLLPLR